MKKCGGFFCFVFFFVGFFFFFFFFVFFLLETEIVGTRKNRLIEAVLTGTHHLCFIAGIRKIMYTPANPIFSL